MQEKTSDRVVVITGASSGIGRAAAQLFAATGASVVLAARGREKLEEVADEVRRAGGVPLVVPTDVRSEDEVKALARSALKQFGRIDVWVNNAAVSLFARTEDAPYEAYKQVIETNLFGCIHGARAVIPCFRGQGYGVLINVGSVAGIYGQAYTSAYCVTKFGIRGLGESLRQELLDTPDIHVCTLMPATIDTPIFQHAANYTGRAVQPMPPVIDTYRVAHAMVSLAERPRRELIIGWAAKLLAVQHKFAPGMTERQIARMVEDKHLQERPAPLSPGNLFQSMPELSGVSGGWKHDGTQGRRKRLPAAMAVAVPTAAAVAAMAAVVLFLRR
ncbi:SDR family oxidoreductase [Chondromyces apiculatus]|uniref:Oxidoreductase, short chain dehydrogenase/reductase family n=1 Tax=Chondromyces apiculatus DSM 436 TaxID=1192034 RepID=A0A017TD93_9BACT|nr:SDR family oxidoreductase [Chondromyces apiculatus]EYF06897.1 oxidoreductase, short chain dehydrogenase/reductase family [Chondromyces apiculatus DSM 436]